MMYYKLFILYFLTVTTSVMGQMKSNAEDSVEAASLIIQPNRIEFEYKSADREFHIITAEDKGLLVIQETRTREKEGFVWKMHMLDTGLNVVWEKDLIVKYGWTYLGFDFNQKDFILLFNTAQYNSEKLAIMKYGLDGGNMLVYQFNSVIPLELSHFEVIEDGLIFGGISNGRPAIIYLDLNSRRPKVLPGIYNQSSSIVSIETSDKYKMFSVLVSEKTATKDYSITLKVFSSKGELVYSSSLETEREKSLIDAVSTYFRNGVQYVSGTYSNRKTNQSIGFYIAKIEGGEQSFIKYHPYTDLYNFFSYMKDKKQKKVEEKIDRKKIRGKNVKMNYHLLVHEIVRRGEEFILIGEAYYPKYSTSPYSSSIAYDPFTSQSQPTNPQTLLGYQYSHAVVVGFNKDGDILWDNSFEINDVLLPTLEENIQVNVENDRIVLLYVFENMIRSRVLTKGDLVEGKAFDPIELTHEYDEIKEKSSGISGLKEWYANYFYAFGTQKIRNKSNEVENTNRRVFYVNKVSFK